ncbi:hypothetical protein [Pseudoteredinibacter isoporae]|uniref:LpxL/LpxP family acyltransferase n=1 Tax=Pseudoteredinibacter isoporae TaxID=570281 RepID=UPI003108D18F
MDNQHWSELKEAGALSGIRFMFFVYKYFGRLPFKLVLYPVILYFYARRHEARAASLEYLEQLNKQHAALEPSKWLSFKHFLEFGESLLDKLAVWQGDISLDDILFHPRDAFLSCCEKGQGGILIGSHLGNLEICRALSLQQKNTRINVLMHTSHAENFNKILKQLGSEQLSIIQVNSINPATAMMLNEKVQQGEFIVLTGDRTPPSGDKNSSVVNFLGREADFPNGPMILASLLKCPVFTLFCFRSQRPDYRYEIFLDEFSEKIVLPRKDKQSALNQYSQSFADRLASFCKQFPLQWYNFYSLWKAQAHRNPHKAQEHILPTSRQTDS